MNTEDIKIWDLNRLDDEELVFENPSIMNI